MVLTSIAVLVLLQGSDAKPDKPRLPLLHSHVLLMQRRWVEHWAVHALLSEAPPFKLSPNQERRLVETYVRSEKPFAAVLRRKDKPTAAEASQMRRAGDRFLRDVRLILTAEQSRKLQSFGWRMYPVESLLSEGVQGSLRCSRAQAAALRKSASGFDARVWSVLKRNAALRAASKTTAPSEDVNIGSVSSELYGATLRAMLRLLNPKQREAWKRMIKE
jgi:hypothetical protein